MDQWYVKIDDGTIYGPVDTETLKGWAAQGRVEPASELSADQQQWIPAARMRELQMDWIAELPDGSSYGPFNICLLPELKQDGVLPSKTVLRHKHSGETHDLDEALPDPVRDAAPDTNAAHIANGQQDLFAGLGQRPSSPTPEPTEQSAPQAETTEPEDEPTVPEALPAEPEPQPAAPPEQDEPDEQPQIDELQEGDAPDLMRPEEIPAAAPPMGEAVVEADELPVSPAEAVGGAMLAQRIQTLQNSASLARSQLSATRKELNEQKAYSTTLIDQLRRLEEDLTASDAARTEADRSRVEQNDRVSMLESELENATAQLQQLQEHYDRLQLEAQKQFETLDETRAQLLQQEQQHQEHLALYNERLADKKAHMIRTLQTLLRDEDLLDPSIPEHLLPQSDAQPQLDQLRADLEQTQAMYRQERDQVRDLEQRMTALASHQLPRAALVVVGALLVACGVLLGMVLRGGIQKQVKPSVPPAAGIQPAQGGPAVPTGSPPIGDLPPDSANLNPGASAPERPGAAGSIQWPNIQYAGAVATLSNGQYRIVFNEGLFAQETQLTQTGIQDLSQIADILRPTFADFRLKIEGHTDAVPVTTRGSNYSNNYALGQDRAGAVRALLVTKCGLPANQISTTSAGENDPPFPNNTEAMRRRNRTVVLLLEPRRD